jgi:hypothetical protein
MEFLAEACASHIYFGLKGSKGVRMKHKNIDHTVVANIALWIVVFQ